MSVVGIDLSLVGSAFAAEAGASCVFRTFAPPKKMIGIERLDWICTQIRDELLARQAHLIVFEDLAFAAHDRNHERAGLATLVRWRCWRDKMPYVLVAPTTLKKFVTGSGKGEKNMMLLAVYKRWQHNPANDNESDAIGLMYIGLGLTGRYKPKTAAEKQVIEMLKGKNQEMLRAI